MRFLLIVMFFVYGFGSESIYIWSKMFNKMDNNKMIHYLKKSGINIAIISFKKRNENKFKKFMILAKNNNIKIQILIGDNKWIYPEKRVRILRKLNYLKQFGLPIHLDVEPHAIKSLKYHREKYLKMYVNMLKYIKENYPYNINISIPTFYKVKFVIQMSNFIDKIYLMAYEYKNIGQLFRRIGKYKQFNIVVVFNCKEFSTPSKLNKDVKIVKKLYKNIAFHNLKTYIRVYH